MCQCPTRIRRLSFTLIELLVVISIIALLIALLLPSLQEAKRRARVLLCATNMRTISIGMVSYLNDENDQYLPTWYHPTIFQAFFSETSITPFDNRENLIRIAGGITDVYYCPLTESRWWPENSQIPVGPEDHARYADVFHVENVSTYRHTTMTHILVGLYEPLYNWAGTGNPDGLSPRQNPGHPDAQIVADFEEGHGLPHRDSNVLYGDGHVKTHATVDNFVTGGYRTFRY